MTQRSLLWNGTVAGDAVLAPYDKVLFNTYMAGLHVDDQGGAYVIPGYLNDLEIVENGSLGFSVLSGAAVFGDYIYINDATLSFSVSPAATGNFRYDLLVLEKDSSTQKVRLKVVAGSDTASYATLSDPPITTNQHILARFYIEGAASILDETYILDQRTFAYNNYASSRYGGFQGNLIRNSEFLARSSADGSRPPDMWYTYGFNSPSPGDWSGHSAFIDILPRGIWVRYDGQDNTGMAQDFEYNDVRLNDKVVLTVKGRVFLIDPASSPSITVALRRYDNGEIIRSQTFKNLDVYTEAIYQFTVPYEEEHKFTLSITAVNGYAGIGPVIVVPGYHPGPFRFFRETVLFNEPMYGTGWNATAKSTGTTTISIGTTFSAYLADTAIKAIILKLKGNDSGSAAGSPYMAAEGYANPYNAYYCIVELTSVNNDSPRESVGVVPVNQNLTDADELGGQFRILVSASGAGTFDATAAIIGIMT